LQPGALRAAAAAEEQTFRRKELEAHTDESMVGERKKNPVVHGLDRLRLGFGARERGSPHRRKAVTNERI
jgi:hypothetical protein